MCQTSYLLYRQFLPTWIHRSSVVTVKHITGFTAQKIIENFCSNPNLARKDSNISGKTQLIIILRDSSMEEMKLECCGKSMIAALGRDEATFLLVGRGGLKNIRKSAWVEERCGLEGSGGLDFGEPENQLLASVSIHLLNTYLDTTLNVGVVRDS